MQFSKSRETFPKADLTARKNVGEMLKNGKCLLTFILIWQLNDQSHNPILQRDTSTKSEIYEYHKFLSIMNF